MQVMADHVRQDPLQGRRPTWPSPVPRSRLTNTADEDCPQGRGERRPHPMTAATIGPHELEMAEHRLRPKERPVQEEGLDVRRGMTGDDLRPRRWRFERELSVPSLGLSRCSDPRRRGRLVARQSADTGPRGLSW